ncbi:unnamed protein product [Paramecium pentaurelia]|uniref:WD40-repeat-containing domain n=1 Tax=Paramecium pentaurelia TaxID=43138 RepID=A0A8S1UI84_9CILI|nr:unnamed protein product [Paramecium pentaurelia]
MVDLNNQKLNTKMKLMINDEIQKLNNWKIQIEEAKNQTTNIYNSLISSIDDWVANIKEQEFSIENKKFLDVLDEMSDNEENWIKNKIFQIVSQMILIDSYTHKRLQIQFNQLNTILNNFAMNNQFNEIFSQNMNIFWDSYKSTDQYPKKLQNNFENVICKSHNLPVSSLNIQKNIPLDQRVNCRKCKGKGESIEEFIKNLDQYFVDQSKQLQSNSRKFKKVIQKNWLDLIKELQYSFFSQLNELTFSLLSEEQKLIIEFICQLSKQHSFQIKDFQDLCLVLSQKDQSIIQFQIGNQQGRILEFVKNLITKLSTEMKKIREQHLKIQKKNNSQSKDIEMQIQRQVYWKELPQNTMWFDLNTKPNCVLITKLDQLLLRGINNCIEINYFKNQNLKKILWLPKKQYVTCFVDCQVQNSFIVGYNDGKLQYWTILKPQLQLNIYNNIEQQNQNLSNVHQESPQYHNHTDKINFMIFQNENQYQKYLFSASSDGLINYWELKLYNNRIYFQYSLKKHEKSVIGLALNQNQQTLASCGEDNKIIIWTKNYQQKTQDQQDWQFKYIIKQSIDNFGKKISFLTQDILILVSEYVHVFQLKQDLFVEQKQKKIKLFPSANDNFDFPISHIQNGVVCFGHSQHVYIVSLSKNQEINLSSDPIGKNKSSRLDHCCGALSSDSKSIVIWTPYCQIYELFY